MLAVSGVNFGIVRSVPHMLGISIGFLVLLPITVAAMGTTMETYLRLMIFKSWI